MKLTEKKIREAQEVIEAVMAECELLIVNFNITFGVSIITKSIDDKEADTLAELYINRLHELAGTEPPPF